MNQYQIKKISTLDNDSIKRWLDLWNEAENANVFNSYDWFAGSMNSKEMDKQCIYFCYKKDTLEAVLPLVKGNRYGIGVLTTPDSFAISEESILLRERSSELLKYFIDEIAKEGNLYLTRINEETAIKLKEVNSKVYLTVISVNPTINLQQDPLISLARSTEKNIKKATNGEEKYFKFKLYNHKDNLEDKLKIMFEIDSQSGKEKHSRNIFSREQSRKFFHNMIKNMNKFVEICILYYKNKPIAYNFNLVSKNVYFAYQTSYLYQFRKYSPGKITIIELLKTIGKQEYKIFDFGEGLSFYKQEFTQKYVKKYDLHYSQNIFVKLWWKIIITARMYKQILRPEKYSRDHEFLFREI